MTFSLTHYKIKNRPVSAAIQSNTWKKIKKNSNKSCPVLVAIQTV
jgi:hypothetical protein